MQLKDRMMVMALSLLSVLGIVALGIGAIIIVSKAKSSFCERAAWCAADLLFPFAIVLFVFKNLRCDPLGGVLFIAGLCVSVFSLCAISLLCWVTV